MTGTELPVLSWRDGRSGTRVEPARVGGETGACHRGKVMQLLEKLRSTGGMVLLAACAGSACSDPVLAAGPESDAGIVQVQGTYCPPSQMPYAPYVPAPAYPYMMPPGAPYPSMPRPAQPMQPTPQQPSQTPGQQPRQTPGQQPQQPSQTPGQQPPQQQQAPNLARPTFTPPASAPTTARVVVAVTLTEHDR